MSKKERSEAIRKQVIELIKKVDEMFDIRNDLYSMMSDIAKEEEKELDDSIFDILSDITDGQYSLDDHDNYNTYDAVRELEDCII